MSKKGLTGKRAVWYGLLGTPVLLVAAVTLIGVTAGSAGPSTAAKPAAASSPSQVVGGPVSHTTALGSGQQTLAELKAYWSVPGRMANATPYPVPTVSTTSTPEGSIQSVPDAGPLHTVNMTAGGGVEKSVVPTSPVAGALTEGFHNDIPYTQWQWFGRYLRNIPAGSPNLGIAAIHKMFFTQNGSNFVCSSSTIGQDGVWTAGHCVSDGSSTFSTNVLFCPSYDSAQGGVNPTAGCWGAAELWVWSPQWHVNGDLDYDFGGADANDTGTAVAGLIGDFTGWLGMAYNATDGQSAPNIHWLSFGYPLGAPFTGGKIETCASSLGYIDAATAGGIDSVAMGCDMTGGSSGGPWIFGFGRFPTQPGGNALLAVNGHNDWRHTSPNEPNEMNSPAFNCRALDMYNAINDLGPATCP